MWASDKHRVIITIAKMGRMSLKLSIDDISQHKRLIAEIS